MVIIKLKGGLGNQLFQYAFGRLLSIKRREELWLDKDVLGQLGDTYRYYGLDNFNIKARPADPEEVRSVKYPFGLISKAWRFVQAKILRRYHVGYEPSMLNDKKKYIDGYFQSYKYLEPIRNELLAEITLKNQPDRKYRELLARIKESDSVAVHIRRTDYLNDVNSKNFAVFGLEFYQTAIMMIKEKVASPIFFVFSDDIGWAKKNLATGAETVYVSDQGFKDYEELMLMSYCRHQITANSSFSFWGAWLNQNPEKIVITPKQWSRFFAKEQKDLLPENWIKV
jgi:hypothetical protein